MKRTKQHKFAKKMFDRWITRLGLRWWDGTVNYIDHKKTLKRVFGKKKWRTVAANARADWRYGKAWIEVNLRVINAMEKSEIEEAVVHELVHVLVNEMREGEIHHEERVVTQLTKGIFWTVDDVKKKKGK